MLMEKKINFLSELLIKKVFRAKSLLSKQLRYIYIMLDCTKKCSFTNSSIIRDELTMIISSFTDKLGHKIAEAYYKNDFLPLYVSKRYRNNEFYFNMDSMLSKGALQEIFGIKEFFPPNYPERIKKAIIDHICYNPFVLHNFTASKMVSFMYRGSQVWKEDTYHLELFEHLSMEAEKIFLILLTTRLEEFRSTYWRLKKRILDSELSETKLIKWVNKSKLNLYDDYKRVMNRKYDAMTVYFNKSKALKSRNSHYHTTNESLSEENDTFLNMEGDENQRGYTVSRFFELFGE